MSWLDERFMAQPNAGKDSLEEESPDFKEQGAR